MTNEFIQQNFVTPEIATALKELAFNERCFGYYDKGKFNYDDMFRSNSIIKQYLAPEYSIEDFAAAALWQQAICYLNEISDSEKLPTAYIKDFDLRNPVLVAKEIEDSISEIKFIRASRLKAIGKSTH